MPFTQSLARTLCQPVLIVRTFAKNCKFDAPFKVLTEQVAHYCYLPPPLPSPPPPPHTEEDHQQLTSVQYILQLCQKAREKQIAIETGQYDMVSDCVLITLLYTVSYVCTVYVCMWYSMCIYKFCMYTRCTGYTVYICVLNE